MFTNLNKICLFLLNYEKNKNMTAFRIVLFCQILILSQLCDEQVEFFQVVISCNVVAGYQHFRWRQHVPLKQWHPTTTIHGITMQKNLTWIFIAERTSNLVWDEQFTAFSSPLAVC